MNCNKCAETLPENYERPSVDMEINYDQPKPIPLFDLSESSNDLKKMRNRRGADNSKIVVKLIKIGSPLFHQKVLGCCNDISTGRVPENWHIAIFTMLPKSGDLKNVSNWRPIDILPILYKIFAKMLYYRLVPILDKQSVWVST